jgi:hypothetical protein
LFCEIALRFNDEASLWQTILDKLARAQAQRKSGSPQ